MEVSEVGGTADLFDLLTPLMPIDLTDLIKQRQTLFALHQTKSIFSKILVVVCIDIVLLTGLVIWLNATIDLINLEIFVLEGLFVANLGFAVVCRFVAPKFYLPFLINTILSAVIFHCLFLVWSLLL